jgi:sigma-B regulation protein RsbU (phosphoserine phosphatase)
MREPESTRDDVAAISRISAVPTILRVVTEVTGLRLSLIARVTATEWVACAVNDHMNFGLAPGGTLDVATTLCSQVRDTHQSVIINHASSDPDFCDHPTPKMYGFESYISVPIFLADGAYFGNICALDSRPAQVKEPRIEGMMRLFAELISSQLAAEAQLGATRAELLDARKTAELREQFIAVLGHDLRNPLSSVVVGAETLLRRSLDDAARSTVQRIVASGRRMSGLVSDLLDFARARLGSGIGVSPSDVSDLATSLRHVIAELEGAHAERTIVASIEISGTIRCDRDRIGQLLSNLLANALEHGSSDSPVGVRIAQSQDQLTIAVHNQGLPIPAATIPLLFRPYSRGGPGSRNGLGLGLYIAHEIAKAHHGRLDVSSAAETGTTFTLSLPLETRVLSSRP